MKARLRSRGRGATVATSLLLSVATAVLAGGCAVDEEKIQVSPRPEVVRLHGDTVVEARQLSLELPGPFEDKYRAATDTLRARLGATAGSGGTVPVRLEIGGEPPQSRDSATTRALSHPEGYVLRISSDGARVVASTAAGALRGLTTLEELALRHDGGLPAGVIVDWPDHSVRALHFVLRGVTRESARRLVNLARENQFNTLIVQLADGVALPSQKQIARPDAWSPGELASFADYVRQNGLELIPEVKLLTHQDKLFKNRHPELMYNSETYDPRVEATYRRVSRILDDVIATVDPDAVHIGHDEVAGVGSGERAREQLGQGEEPLPARLFLEDVRRVHEMLAARDVETWMWGDMLIGPSEFPDMLGRHLHGVPAYTDLRGRLPDDIVICDWHYSDRQADFPSLQAFLSAGHPVLGATWRRPSTARRFSRYADRLADPRMRGLIATTWWLVQRGRWDELRDVAELSGDAFWNAGSGAGSDEREATSGPESF